MVYPQSLAYNSWVTREFYEKRLVPAREVRKGPFALPRSIGFHQRFFILPR